MRPEIVISCRRLEAFNRCGGPTAAKCTYLAPDATLMAVPIRPGAAFSAGEPRPLFKTEVLAPAAEIEQYAPSADGSRFLMLDFADDGRMQSVQVLSNWRALVGGPTPR